ncbi:GNAT family N-acetyltransferase [Thermomonas carbonis]|uniref:GNAT family N-acetyltransferase n=1 Tax=Thermomonas carbonis TaxID=1463158 RepID=A0A7G9SNP3_9GAMM|nr:GNAT family N-acetyltransferase [Thermomonas carbonis]QNN69468.1 GNAT family N-acetyltransferase [Thermomonas carbonis]GHB93310.1 N-acetyltransferase [Thermomonas carbonis]
MERTITLECLSGAALLPHLDAVAALRIAVFRDWPYLYDGDVAYEREYLDAYAQSADSLVVLARDGDVVIGASTGIPLAADSAEFQAPFLARGIDATTVFYCGESVLLPAWRGRGIGHAFFDAREAHARALGGFAWTAFAAVDRDERDPRRPPNHRGNEAFWSKRGYLRQPGMTMRLHWNETGIGDIDHPLTFWLRPLDEDTGT